MELSGHPHGDADEHGRDGDPGQEGDAYGGANQGAELPHQFLLAGPAIRRQMSFQATCR